VPDARHDSLTDAPRRDAQPAGDLRAALVQVGPAVRRYLFGLCGDWHEADDAAQEALLKAWRSRASFDGRAAVQTWVFAIARNHWRDRLRRRRRRPTEQDVSGMNLPSPTDAPDAAAQRGELAAAVHKALAALPAEQREALALRESGGLSFPQIAELLGVPAGTVKSRVRYALLKLAAELKPLTRENSS